MPRVKILTEHELRQAVRLDAESVDCIEACFRTLAEGIKVSPGFFDNHKLGLPSTTGLMLVHDSVTGFVEAVLLDNGYLTDVRTAAAGAVSVRHMAREDASSVAVLGTGVQARLQLEAIRLVRDVRKGVVCSRDPGRAEELATRLREDLGIEIEATTDREAAVGSSDILVKATPAREPLVEAAWLRPGQHVVAVGSDQANKVELAAECATRADVFAVDKREQSAERGELRYAIEQGVVPSADGFPELGEIVAGRAVGRPSLEAITICDLTGTGVQDTAIANLARERAAKADAGLLIEN
jgi:ornithine cyclodeaminase